MQTSKRELIEKRKAQLRANMENSGEKQKLLERRHKELAERGAAQLIMQGKSIDQLIPKIEPQALKIQTWSSILETNIKDVKQKLTLMIDQNVKTYYGQLVIEFQMT